MPVNRKRQKLEHTGGIPSWFITYLKTGKPPAEGTPESDEFYVWSLFAGEHIHGIKHEDCYYAKERKAALKKLGLDEKNAQK